MSGNYPDLMPVFDNPGRCNAVGDLLAERNEQDQRDGGASADDKREESEWLILIEDMTGEYYVGERDFRNTMVKVAAIALAAIESHDRKLGV